jgi:hypothetical protein
MLLALVFLLLLSTLASTVLERAMLQMRLAGNHQARDSGIFVVTDIVDALAATPGVFDRHLALDQSRCLPGDGSSDCVGSPLSLPWLPSLIPGHAQVTARVRRVRPWEMATPPGRELPGASGTEAATYGVFEIEASLTSPGGGIATVRKGVVVRVDDDAGDTEDHGAPAPVTAVYWSEEGVDDL